MNTVNVVLIKVNLAYRNIFSSFVFKKFSSIITLILFIAFVAVTTLKSATITGRISEKHTGKPLVGANVRLKKSKLGAISSEDGNFKISNVHKGKYELLVTAIGYKTDKDEYHVEVKDENSTVTIEIKMKNEDVKMARIVVEARADKELESAGRQTEKNSQNIVNVITAQSIERSTDKSAADVLQRVSGLSLVRENGEGKYVVMRGLAQRYNNTLVNGIKVPSPESNDRFVPLDIFPSELLQRIEVTKSLTPDLEGDAIGGSANLIFKDAPDKEFVSVRASTGYSSFLFDNKFAKFNSNAVNDEDPNQQNGTVNPSEPLTLLKQPQTIYETEFTRENLKFNDITAPIDQNFALVAGDRFFDKSLGIIASGIYQKKYNRSEANYYEMDINTNNDWVPYLATIDKRNYSTLKTRIGLAAKMDYIVDFENELSFDYIYVNQEIDESRFGNQTRLDGQRGAADIIYTQRSAVRTQNISNYLLEGKHKLFDNSLDLKWNLDYSEALQERPDEAQISIYQTFIDDTLTPQVLHDISRVWRQNDDKQYIAKLDLSYKPDFIDNFALGTGGLIQRLNRTNYQNQFTLYPVIDTGKSQTWSGVDSADIYVFTKFGGAAYDYQNYIANETVIAAYLQGFYKADALQILGGVRLETTSDDYKTNAPVSVGAGSASIGYFDILPGIHFRYELNDEQILRLEITRTLSRPSYFELVPAREISDGGSFIGNVNLRPAHSNNLDIKWEYYPSQKDFYSAGTYFKSIEGAIESSINAGNSADVITQKINAGTAYVYGLELAFAKHFGNFTISANYSYVYSSILMSKFWKHNDSTGTAINPVPTFTQTRSLQAQSPHVANVTVSYENEDLGTSLSLAYNFTGRRLEIVSFFDGQDVYQDNFSELDFSANQEIFNDFKVFVKATNILNSPTTLEVPTGEYVKHETLTLRNDYERANFRLGFSYKF